MSSVSVKSNLAIPFAIPLPVEFTLTGRAFNTKILIICHQLACNTEQDCQMLFAGALTTDMDTAIVLLLSGRRQQAGG
ncbi:MAG: hypothetical protein ACTH4U_04310 [Pseudoalteromonas prydzensis]|uniref:hypothetical protein n=1 Tax=Pseudoalteromonas prydzensis TaxID=182141 RepID=UPI003F958021